jgi:hypothetical protein
MTAEKLLDEGPKGKPVANPQWRPPSQWLAIGPPANPQWWSRKKGITSGLDHVRVMAGGLMVDGTLSSRSKEYQEED